MTVPRQLLTVRLDLRVTKKCKSQLKALTKEMGCSASDVIRQLIQERSERLADELNVTRGEMLRILLRRAAAETGGGDGPEYKSVRQAQVTYGPVHRMHRG